MEELMRKLSTSPSQESMSPVERRTRVRALTDLVDITELIRHCGEILESSAVTCSSQMMELLSKLHTIVCEADASWLVSCGAGKANLSLEGDINSERSQRALGQGDGVGLVALSHFLLKYCSVSNFQGKEDVGFETCDFAKCSDKSILAMSILIISFDKLNATRDKEGTVLSQISKRQMYANAVYLALEQASHELWTTEESQEMSSKLLVRIFSIEHCENLSEYLCGKDTFDMDESNEERNGFSIIMLILKPRLTKSTWKVNPSAKSVFRQILFSLKFPLSTNQVECVLPPSLIFIDDHQTENKMLGLKCIQHVINNSTCTELLMFGRAEVVYHAVYNLVYTRDSELLDALLPCLLSLLKILEPTSSRMSVDQQQTKHGEILGKVLYNMEMEDNLKLRRVYAFHLGSLVRNVGIDILKHMQRIMRVIFTFLEIDDGSNEATRRYILDTLVEVIKVAWPRMENRCEEIQKRLFRLIYGLLQDNDEMSDGQRGTYTKCTECLVLMKTLCPQRFISNLDGLISLSDTPEWVSLVAKLSET